MDAANTCTASIAALKHERKGRERGRERYIIYSTVRCLVCHREAASATHAMKRRREHAQRAPWRRSTNGKVVNAVATLISTVQRLVCHRESAYCYACKETPRTCTVSTLATKRYRMSSCEEHRGEEALFTAALQGARLGTVGKRRGI